MSSEARIIGEVLDALADHITGAWIGEELPPHDELERNLPAILVEDVPGHTDAQPWGAGPLIHAVAVDIEVYGRSFDAVRTIGTAVERIIHHLVVEPGSSVSRVIQETTFHKRPDWNPRVKRVGAEFELRTTNQ